jgi:hypothetical protein
MPPRRFRAPTGDGEVLADPPFAAVPDQIAANRRRLDAADVRVGGLPLPDLRRLARHEILALTGDRTASPDAPLLLAGHQPELFHPGVWVKNFALHGLARRVGGVPLNLVVDNDTLKAAAIRLPTWERWEPAAVRLDRLAFDAVRPEEPFETRAVADPGLFESFGGRVCERAANWGYRPLACQAWADALGPGTVGARLTAVRVAAERRWGCHNLELPVSRLAGTETFARFAGHVAADADRFRGAYNAAVRDYRRRNGLRSTRHPVPDLAADELPFWGTSGPDGRRTRATADTPPGHLRPRALTLTLFARLCVGDFFLHGIGGGKYDEVTDDIVRRYFGLEPPAYQVLSATLHLPLPHFPGTPAEVDRLDRLERDLHWNPHRYLSAEARAEHARLAAAEPADRRGRRQRTRDLRALAGRLRPLVAGRVEAVRADRERAKREAAANAILRRRDYAWVLYPEATLRPFLRRFLDVT